MLIYPLFYSMRHCVELALKISIYYIRNICYIKKVNSCIEEKALYTHDIEKLAGFLKQLYGIDKRIPELFDTALEYVEDYYIDKQSDVFRYEHNHDGKELLKLLDISQICIGILEEKFLRMYELLDNAICCLEDIRYEYSLKTWTNELSRNDIQQISKELLPITKWQEDSFDDNRNKIRKEYGLGSRALSRAINIIKTNPLFANNIGYPIELGKISAEELKQYAKLVSECSKPDLFKIKGDKVGDGIEKLLEKSPEETARLDELSERLSDEAIISLAAFGDMFESRDLYCENYQKHYDHFKDDCSIRRDYLIKKIKNYRYALCVLKGMELCGQSHYINILSPLIEKIAEENNYTWRYEKTENII